MINTLWEARVDSTPVRAGDETPAYCTTCRDMRVHVVIAIDGVAPARVECRSCHKQHKYRAALPGSKAAKTTRAAAARGEGAPRSSKPRRASSEAGGAAAVAAINPLDALLGDRSTSGARSYSPGDSYVVGELLSHPNFGLGAVTATPSPGKISVLFRDHARLLLHQRTTASPAAAVGGVRLEPPTRRDVSADASSERPPKVRSIL